MKLLVLVSLVGACAAGALSPAYLPPAAAARTFPAAAPAAPVYYTGSGAESARPRAALERSAAVLRQEADASEAGYRFAYETENGIRAEESAVEQGGVQARGGYSYTGDDNQVYSVSYEAGEGGFQAQGAHLPTPPPTPDAILKALEENARDEAAGIFDDGSYQEDKYGLAQGQVQYQDAVVVARAQGNAFSQQSNALSRQSNAFSQQNNAFSQQNNAFSRQSNAFSGQRSAPSREYLTPKSGSRDQAGYHY